MASHFLTAVCYHSYHGYSICLLAVCGPFTGFSFSPNSDFRNLPFRRRRSGYAGQVGPKAVLRIDSNHLFEASFPAAISTARQQKSISLEKRAEATYAEHRSQKGNVSGGHGFRLPLW
jgi:hypothetical protein